MNAIMMQVVEAALAERLARMPTPDTDTLLADVDEFKQPTGILRRRLPREGQEVLSLIEGDLHKLSGGPGESKRERAAWSHAMLLLERALDSIYRKEYWQAMSLRHMAQEYIGQPEPASVV